MGLIKEVKRILPPEIEQQQIERAEFEAQKSESSSSSDFDSEASESEPDSDLTPAEKEKFLQEKKEY